MNDFFKNKSPKYERLLPFGFQTENRSYVFRTEIMEGQFLLSVKIDGGGEVRTELIDTMTDEPYTLHLVEEASGAFVGEVREAYAKVLNEIAEKCFETFVFREAQTRDFLDRVCEKYGDSPEYLWDKFPDNAVLRRRDTGKWYGIVMTVERKKLGLEGSEKVEILDVRADPQEIAFLVDGKRYFPAWHMNKKNWITVLLDGTLSMDELLELVEGSWHLATK